MPSAEGRAENRGVWHRGLWRRGAPVGFKALQAQGSVGTPENPTSRHPGEAKLKPTEERKSKSSSRSQAGTRENADTWGQDEEREAVGLERWRERQEPRNPGRQLGGASAGPRVTAQQGREDVTRTTFTATAASTCQWHPKSCRPFLMACPMHISGRPVHG